MLTAWISVGVGEILAVFLLLRGYSIVVAVASAVCLSALTVLAGIPWHIIQHNIIIEILIFAAPGALIGGFIARYIAIWMSPQKLKLFISIWILGIGLFNFVWQ